MKAKLIKIDKDNYTLFDEKGIPIGTTPNVLSNNTFSKLSKQNCDSLFGVVDVEKLAEESWGDKISYVYHAYIEGFNKAMELNKDKVFTEEDMISFGRWIISNQEFENTSFWSKDIAIYHLNKWKSIQQPTEIDVEIEMFIPGATYGHSGWHEEPKLDSEGCLILKRVV